MRRRLITAPIAAVLGLAGALLGAPLATASPVEAASVATAAESPTLAVLWDMSPTGTTVRDPSSGLSLNLMGTWWWSAGLVQFGGGAPPSMGLSYDMDKLSPGWHDFAVAATLTTSSVPRTGNFSPNVVQKGYSGVGGQWKMQLHPSASGTMAECRFEGSKGAVLLRDRSGTRLDNDRAHVVACWRKDGRLGVTVDGRDTVIQRIVGYIKPRTGTTVANKKSTAGIQDQLQGSVSCVAVAMGDGSRELALSKAAC